MKCFGWTVNQWALAAYRTKASMGTLLDAVHMKRNYIIKYRGEPLDQPIILNENGELDHDRPMDLDYAGHVFSLASLASGG